MSNLTLHTHDAFVIAFLVEFWYVDEAISLNIDSLCASHVGGV